MNRLATCLAAFALSAGAAIGAEKTVMHCFAFTPIESASQAEWDAFYKATSALPEKIPGVKRVWAGKLARPLPQYQVEAEARKKAADTKKGTGDFTIATRSNGVCMEFEDMAAYKAYGPHPEHKNWVAVYEKVRVPGTTTYQIIPE